MLDVASIPRSSFLVDATGYSLARSTRRYSKQSYRLPYRLPYRRITLIGNTVFQFEIGHTVLRLGIPFFNLASLAKY